MKKIVTWASAFVFAISFALQNGTAFGEMMEEAISLQTGLLPAELTGGS